MSSPLRKAKLISRRELTPSVVEVTFQMVEPQMIEYQSGQFIILHTAQMQGKSLKRSYSIASPPSPERLRLCIKVILQGISSNFIKNLKEGQEVSFSGPWGKGKLTFPQETGDTLVFVATGTGISPIFSLLSEHLPRHPHKEFKFYWGLRSQDDLFYLDELNVLRSSFPYFSYAVTLSQAREGWSGSRGRVTTLLAQLLGDFKDSEWFLAGNGGMIYDLSQMLLEKGIPDARIHKETFFTPQK